MRYLAFFRDLALTSVCFCAGQAFGQFNIVDYGAVRNGSGLSTLGIQAAIDACFAKGGGTVIVPEGVFLTGTLHLKSNVDLHLEPGAVLRGSARLDDYEWANPVKGFNRVHKGMLFTEDAENVSISGSGRLDGNGDVFFDTTRAKKMDSLTTQYSRQGKDFRRVDKGIGDGPIVPLDRPYQMFVFSHCSRVTIKDVFITKSPFWCMHFADCDAVHVTGIRLWNNMLAPNADGIDVTSCTNVIIDGCDIRTGDDALAIGGYDHHFEIPGFRGLRHFCGNIVVSNCNLQSSSSGIRIGFLDQNTVENVRVSNVNITNSNRGICICLRDQGSLRNLSFSNLYIETHMLTGDWWGNGEPIQISAIRGKDSVPLGWIEHVQFNNIICKGEGGMVVFSSQESLIRDVSFKNISFDFVNSHLNERSGGNVDFRGASGYRNALFARDIPGLWISHVNGLTIDDFVLNWIDPQADFLSNGIEVEDFKDVRIIHFRGTGAPNKSGVYAIKATNGEGLETDGDNSRLQLLHVR